MNCPVSLPEAILAETGRIGKNLTPRREGQKIAVLIVRKGKRS